MAQNKIYHYMSVTTGELATDYKDALRINAEIETLLGVRQPVCYFELFWIYSEEGF